MTSIEKIQKNREIADAALKNLVRVFYLGHGAKMVQIFKSLDVNLAYLYNTLTPDYAILTKELRKAGALKDYMLVQSLCPVHMDWPEFDAFIRICLLSANGEF